jgi:hypothetical protein
MIGLIDESTPESARGIHYVIGAAVLLEPTQRDEVRERLLKLMAGRTTPFHWKREGIQKRRLMIELLGDLEVGVFAAIHHPVARTRQQAARRQSLEALVPTLVREGVSELIIESRGALDAKDRQAFIEFGHAGLCPSDLTYSFDAKTEPLLWLPDAVAGLLSEAETRKADEWIAELQRVVQIFEVRRLDAHEPRLLS